jgi:hypothetical protein
MYLDTNKLRTPVPHDPAQLHFDLLGDPSAIHAQICTVHFRKCFSQYSVNHTFYSGLYTSNSEHALRQIEYLEAPTQIHDNLFLITSHVLFRQPPHLLAKIYLHSAIDEGRQKDPSRSTYIDKSAQSENQQVFMFRERSNR